MAKPITNFTALEIFHCMADHYDKIAEDRRKEGFREDSYRQGLHDAYVLCAIDMKCWAEVMHEQEARLKRYEKKVLRQREAEQRQREASP